MLAAHLTYLPLISLLHMSCMLFLIRFDQQPACSPLPRFLCRLYRTAPLGCCFFYSGSVQLVCGKQVVLFQILAFCTAFAVACHICTRHCGFYIFGLLSWFCPAVCRHLHRHNLCSTKVLYKHLVPAPPSKCAARILVTYLAAVETLQDQARC